jgi:heat shock protein HtpX
VVDRAISGNRDSGGGGLAYFAIVIVLQIVLGMLASLVVMAFSRWREFRADAGSATLLGTPRPMIGALRRLGGLEQGALPQALQAFGIAEGHAFLGLFASHPPIEERIAALESHRPS